MIGDAALLSITPALRRPPAERCAICVHPTRVWLASREALEPYGFARSKDCPVPHWQSAALSVSPVSKWKNNSWCGLKKGISRDFRSTSSARSSCPLSLSNAAPAGTAGLVSATRRQPLSVPALRRALRDVRAQARCFQSGPYAWTLIPEWVHH